MAALALYGPNGAPWKVLEDASATSVCEEDGHWSERPLAGTPKVPAPPMVVRAGPLVAPKLGAPLQAVKAGLYAIDGSVPGASPPHILCMVFFVLLSYSSALMINALSSSIMYGRYSTESSAGFLIVNLLDPMWLIGSTRMCWLGLVLAVLSRRSHQPGAPPSRGPTELGGLQAFGSGLANAVGYCFYIMLAKLDGVAIWSAMLGLYVVVPVLFFMARGGESRSARKMAGITACVVAAILLGMGKGAPVEGGMMAVADTAAGSTSVFVKLGLLVAAVLSWGVCDTLQVLASRRMATMYVGGFGGLGFGLAGLLALTASWLLSVVSDDLGQPAGPRPPTSTRLAGLAIVAATQGVAMLGWITITHLSSLSEASVFLPIVSLNCIITAIASMVVTGERLNAIGWAGCALGAAGVLALSA